MFEKRIRRNGRSLQPAYCRRRSGKQRWERSSHERGVKLYLIDETHDLTEVPYRMDRNGNLLFSMQANTVVYLEAGSPK